MQESNPRRFASGRIENKGQILFGEIAYLKGIFPGAMPWLVDGKEQCLVESIENALHGECESRGYPAPSKLAEEVGSLRRIVYELIVLLNANDEVAPAASGEDLHEKLRQYPAWQIQSEATLIEPAFRGHGPRRR